MRVMTLLAAGAVCAMISFGVPSTQAAPITPAAKSLAVELTVEHVQMRYCRRWYRECRARWGWGWRFRRCMARHGC